MQTYLDGRSGTDHPLPTGGEVLGYVADAFWLKSCFTDEHGWSGSTRTARRYFNGKQDKVAPDTVRKIIDHLVRNFFPKNYFSSRFDVPDAEIFRRIIGILTISCVEWDRIAGQVNGYRFPNKDPALAAIPALRLATFGCGIRWGTWLYLQYASTGDKIPKTTLLPWWLERDAIKTVFDEYRFDGDAEPTLKEVAAKAGFDLADVTNWRAGKHRPTRHNLEILAQSLAFFSGSADADEIAFWLRTTTGIAYLRGQLEDLCGGQRSDDLFEGFRLVAQCTTKVLAAMDPPTETGSSIVFEVIAKGPHCPAGEIICRTISKMAIGSPFVAEDLVALPRQWTTRLQYWAKLLAQESEEDLRRQEHLLNDSVSGSIDLQMLATFAQEWQLRTRRFVDPPQERLSRIFDELGIDPEDFQLGVTDSEIGRMIWLWMRGEARLSVGDIDGGLRLLQLAIDENPEDASLHYSMGGWLGQVAHSVGNRQLLKQAIHECEIAAALDPKWGRPKNEIGVILSNSGKFEAAEQAFKKAAPLNEDWHQHHLNRGHNLIWLKRYEDAIACFERSLELEPDDLRALEKKGICLLAQGDRRGGKKCLRKTARILGRDLLTSERWKEILDGPG